MTTALTTTETVSKGPGGGERIFALAQQAANPMEFLSECGKAVAQSGMLGVKTPAQGQTLMLACVCENKTPFQLMREYHVMNDGKLTMRSDAMLAQFRQRGGRFKVVQRTPDVASVELTFDGQSVPFEFTWAEAKDEGFIYARDGSLKDNYKTPRMRMQMLWARVISDGVRVMCPEVVAGVYTPEEMEETEVVATVSGGSSSGTGKVSRASKTTATEKPAATTATTTTSKGDVVDAEFTVTPAGSNGTVANEQPPFETDAEAGKDGTTTNVLMDIEHHLGQLGMTKADLEAKMRAKNPAFTSLDDLPPENAAKLLENLRAQVAKNLASQTA